MKGDHYARGNLKGLCLVSEYEPGNARDCTHLPLVDEPASVEFTLRRANSSSDPDALTPVCPRLPIHSHLADPIKVLYGVLWSDFAFVAFSAKSSKSLTLLVVMRAAMTISG